jgi:hypothetical protein
VVPAVAHDAPPNPNSTIWMLILVKMHPKARSTVLCVLCRFWAKITSIERAALVGDSADPI